MQTSLALVLNIILSHRPSCAVRVTTGLIVCHGCITRSGQELMLTCFFFSYWFDRQRLLKRGIEVPRGHEGESPKLTFCSVLGLAETAK